MLPKVQGPSMETTAWYSFRHTRNKVSHWSVHTPAEFRVPSQHVPSANSPRAFRSDCSCNSKYPDAVHCPTRKCRNHQHHHGDDEHIVDVDPLNSLYTVFLSKRPVFTISCHSMNRTDKILHFKEGGVWSYRILSSLICEGNHRIWRDRGACRQKVKTKVLTVQRESPRSMLMV